MASYALMYHRVKDRDHVLTSVYDLSIQDFFDHLKIIRDRNVLLTFDDGYESDWSIVFPRLIALHMKAIFFPTVNNIDREGFVTSSQLREMANAGMEIGSHGLTHTYFSELSDEDLLRELSESKQLLEAITGKMIIYLSVPGGRYQSHVIQMAITVGYGSIFISRPGPTSFNPFPHVVNRLAIRSGTTALALKKLLDSPSHVKFESAKYHILGMAKRIMGNEMYDAVRARIV